MSKSVPGTVVGAQHWTVGRIARITVMLVIAAAFILPIIGFIAMAFRSQAGLLAGTGGFLGLGSS